MKKFFVAVAAGLILFGGQTQAAPVDNLNAQLETQETGTSRWANFRDKYLLGRETENERRDRKEWERRHRYQPPGQHYHDGRGYRPPGSHHGPHHHPR